MATVEVWLSDLEPVASFIARVCAADAGMRQITAEQTAGLPDSFLATWGQLQSAVEDLRACVPAKDTEPVVGNPASHGLP
jgi:hypothetical protein